MVVVVTVLDEILDIDSIFAQKSIFAASNPNRSSSISWCHHQELIEEIAMKIIVGQQQRSNFHLFLFLQRKEKKIIQFQNETIIIMNLVKWKVKPSVK